MSDMTNQQNVFCPKCHNIPQICRCSHESKKEWVGLTYEDMIKVWNETYKGGDVLPTTFALAIEKKLKEKNGAT